MKLPSSSLPMLLATACALTVASPHAAAAEYRFTPEPIYAPDAAREIYKPLMEADSTLKCTT